MIDLIRRLSRKLLRHSISKGSFWMLGGGGFQLIIAFISNIILVRLLFPEDFGRFALVQANVSLIGAIFNMRVNDLLLQADVSELGGTKLSKYSWAFLFETIMIGIVALIELWFLNLLDYKSVLLVIGFLLSSWTAIQTSLYERNFEYKNLSLIETTANISGNILTVAGAFLGLGAFVLYVSELLKQAVKIGGLSINNAIYGLPLNKISWLDCKIYAKKLSGFWSDGLLERLFNQIVIIILGFLSTEKVVGFFHQAKRLAIIPNQLLRPVSFRMLFNYLSREKDYEKKWNILFKAILLNGLLLISAGLFFSFIADPLIPIIFGENWYPVIPLFYSLMGVFIAMPLMNMCKAFFMSNNKMRNFLIFGRGSQFTSLLLALIIVSTGYVSAGVGMSIGLSVGYIMAAILSLYSGNMKIISMKDA